MNTPLIAPSKVRWDMRLLFPDLSRPGSVLRTRTEPDPEAEYTPSTVIERTEKELAAAAGRYRAALLFGAALFLSPGLLAWLMWVLLWNASGLHGVFQPFARGYYVPLVSLYELVSYLVVVILVTLVLVLSYETMVAMRRMGPDYRYFRDATPDVMSIIVDEVSTGSWPRTQSLLRRGREFSGYRPMIDSRLAEPSAVARDVS